MPIDGPVFVDTSAFVAVMDASDRFHQAAAETWKGLVEDGHELVTSNYVVVETCALLQRRMGMEALRFFCGTIYPELQILWVEEQLHNAAMEALLASGRRGLSLVDCASFAIMRKRGLEVAFCFDTHFAEQGFRVIPGSR